MALIELAPCPFCGGYAEFERMGGPRHSCIVACADCGCRLESNEAWPNSGKRWNERVKFTRCTGCDGHECNNGCQYPGASVSNGDRA
jgi:hypothetical protein